MSHPCIVPAKAKLAFGVEFEILLKPKEGFIAELEELCPGWAAKCEQAKKAESEMAGQEATGTYTNSGAAKAEADALRLQFRQQLGNYLMFDGIPSATTSSNFQQWSLVDEPALDEIPGYCRVELVSRTISSNNEWQNELDAVFRRLNTSFDVMCTTGCSMHVHVSPSAKPKKDEDKWTTGQLNNVMKAISYFTNPVNQIMPSERKKNEWAMPNMLSEDVANAEEPLTTAYEQVEAKTWKPLFDIYDRKMKIKLDKIQAFTLMGNCRYVAWNFEHIPGTCGTVEFRQCPGITTSCLAKHWGSFVPGFLYAVAFQTSLDWAQIATQKTHPSVDNLDSLTKAGVEELESTCQGALKKLKDIWRTPVTRRFGQPKKRQKSWRGRLFRRALVILSRNPRR